MIKKSAPLHLRPLLVHVKRYGYYQFSLPVRTVAEGRKVVKRWESACGMSPDERRYPHGVVSTKDGEIVK
jgi:hypothetical protein